MSQNVKTILFLLSDSDPILVRVIKNKFQKDAGWESIITTNYTEAWMAYEKQKPDALMTELLLQDESGKTGFDLIGAIRAKEGGILPIAVFTELAQKEDRERANQVGANYYFIKSQVTLNELIASLKSMLD